MANKTNNGGAATVRSSSLNTRKRENENIKYLNSNLEKASKKNAAHQTSGIKTKSINTLRKESIAMAKEMGMSITDMRKVVDRADKIDLENDMKSYKIAETKQSRTPHSFKNNQEKTNKKKEIMNSYGMSEDDFNTAYSDYRNSKGSQQEDIETYLNSDYRMSKDEQKNAKRLYNAYIKNNEKAQQLNKINNPNMFRKALEGMSQEEKDEYARMTALNGKTNNAAAFMTGFANGVPFVSRRMDKETSKLNNANGFTEANSWRENSQSLSKQSPIANFGGTLASTALLYGMANPIISKIPGVSTATNALATGLSKVPGLDKVGQTAINEFLTDMQADIALDTLPEYITNRRNGMSKSEAKTEALKNLGINAAFNVGGGILNNIPALKAAKNTENIDDVVKNLDDTTENLAKQNADIIAKETGETVPTLNNEVENVVKSQAAEVPNVKNAETKTPEIAAIEMKPEAASKPIQLPGTNGVIELPGTNGVIELPDTQAKQITRSEYLGQDLKAPEITLSDATDKRINGYGKAVSRRGSASMIETNINMALTREEKAATKKERSELKKSIKKYVESGSQADYNDAMQKAAKFADMIDGRTVSTNLGDAVLTRDDILSHIDDIAGTPELTFKRELNNLVDGLKNEKLSSEERVGDYLEFLNKVDQDDNLRSIYESNPELQKFIDEDLQEFINGTEQFDARPTNRKFSLWNKPVSNEFEDAVSKLERGEQVNNDILFNTPEIKEGERIQAETWEKLRKQYNLEDTKKIREQGTKNIDPNERVELHNAIKEDIMNRGSARYTTVDGKKKTVYDNPIRTDRRLDIVAGLPASGKSSAIVDDISNIYGSRVHDNDEIKALIPEFQDGWGAGLVHEESSDLSQNFIKESIDKGENIVLPKVGSKVDSLLPIIEAAKENGYSVNLHYVELPREKAKGRMLSRFASQQRYFKPDMPDKYFDEAGNSLIEKTYEELKGMGVLDGYSKWDNDVKRGESPKLIERSSGDSSFDAVVGRKLGNELREGTDLRSDIGLSVDNGRNTGIERKINEGIEGYSDRNVLSGVGTEGTGHTSNTGSGVGFTENSLSNAVNDGKVSALRTNTAPKTGVLTDEELAQHLPEDMMKYIDVTEKQTVSDAINMIQSEGAENVTNRLLEKEADTFTASDVDALMMLWQSVVDSAKTVEEAGGDATELWAKQRAIFKKTQEIGSNYGQVIQSFAKWGRSTPTGMLAYAEKIINGKADVLSGARKKNALQKKLDNYIKKRHIDIEFSPEFESKFLDEAKKYLSYENKNDRGAKDSLARIGKLVNNELPSSIPEKIKTILMNNMLGNFRTLVSRNAGGNLGFNLLEQLKKVPASQLDKLLAKKTGRRTVANFSLDTFAEYGKGVVAGLADEIDDFKKNVHTQRSGENTLDFFEDVIANNRHVFNPESAKNPFSRGLLKVVDFGDKLVRHGLAVGDRPFYEGTYRQTLAEYKKLGKDAILGKDAGNITDQQFEEIAETCARLNALAAVYQNDGLMSDAFLKMRDGIADLSKAVFGVDILSQFAMPFVKTPANIIERTLEYTPLGVPKNAVQTYFDIKNAKGLKNIDASTQARIANETARNILGTGVFATGAALRNKDKITGAFTDNEKAKALEKAQGKQEYAWKKSTDNGDYNFDISWIPVLGTSLVAGAAAYDAYKNKPEDGLVKNLYSGAKAGGNSLFGQSMFQGMQQLFGADQSYNSAEGIVDNIKNTFKSGVSQGVPSWLRQVANTADTYERDTSNGTFDYAINAGVPGLRQATLEPKVNSFGEEVLSNQGRSLRSRIAENMFSPGKLTKIDNRDLVNEQNRLYDETTKNYADNRFSQYLNNYSVKDMKEIVDKDELTNKEYHDLKQELAGNANMIQNAVINSDFYKNGDNDTQAEALSNSQAMIKAAFKEDYTGTLANQQKKAVEAYREGGVQGYLDFAKAKSNANAATEGAPNKQKATVINGLDKMDLTAEEKGAAIKANSTKLAAETLNVSNKYGDAYIYYTDTAKVAYDSVEGKDTKAVHTKQQKVYDYVNSIDGLSDDQKGAIMYAAFAYKTKQYQTVYDKQGYAGVYHLYEYKQEADTSGNFKVEKEEAEAYAKKMKLDQSTWVPVLKSSK